MIKSFLDKREELKEAFRKEGKRFKSNLTLLGWFLYGLRLIKNWYWDKFGGRIVYKLANRQWEKEFNEKFKLRLK